MTDMRGKGDRWRLCLSESDIEVVHQAYVKPQAASALSCVQRTGMDESLLENDVPVFLINEAQSGGELTRMDEKFRHCLSANETVWRMFHKWLENQTKKTAHDKGTRD